MNLEGGNTANKETEDRSQAFSSVSERVKNETTSNGKKKSEKRAKQPPVFFYLKQNPGFFVIYDKD